MPARSLSSIGRRLGRMASAWRIVERKAVMWLHLFGGALGSPASGVCCIWLLRLAALLSLSALGVMLVLLSFLGERTFMEAPRPTAPPPPDPYACASAPPGSVRTGGGGGNLTVVTAYWALGGKRAKGRDAAVYYDWMRQLGVVENPVVAYFDSNDSVEVFKNLRGDLPTKIIVLDRGQLWSFRQQSRMEAIGARMGYERKIPLDFGYDCANHAKYDVVQMAARANYFQTEYLAWVDIGLFRDLSDYRRFSIGTPPNFTDDRYVAYQLILEMNSTHTIEDIFRYSHFWVAGGLFIGKTNVLEQFCRQYKHYAEGFLRRNLTNTDQQVLYATFARGNAERPRLGIQAYKQDTRFNAWFSLAFVLRERQLCNVHKNIEYVRYDA